MTAGRAGAVLAIAGALLAASPRAAERAPDAGLAGFTVPPGFLVERVAGPPLVERPIAADFDEQGRLYVADSSGSNAKVEQQLAERPHRIIRLEDTNGDGRFDRRVVFADRMMLPQGTLWFDGSLYVAAPPSIWKLTDTDDDGVADRREEWFTGKTLTGCANDLHGPYRAPDGWIYWTKGAFAEQTYERPGREPLVTRAAHVFRRRPGTPLVEPVITGGMDNPIDVAFTAGGDALLTATFLEHPRGGRRDALIHAVYGGLYGKPHGVIEGHAATGELMPPVCHFGPAAPAGLTRYESGIFGERYRGNFFAALFNMQKVTRHELVPEGATFRSRDSDFLVGDSLDFHPTDVVEDADGSLLVVDTGAWYKLCCPTSQLAKPDVLGAIYRVRRKDAPRVSDARGLSLGWRDVAASDLVARLADPRPAVRARAVDVLGARGSAAVGALAAAVDAGRTSVARLNAVWALTRIDDPGAREAVRHALADRHQDVRRAAVHSAGLWRDRAAVPSLLGHLASAAAGLRRAAAEALGRIGDSQAVPALLAAAARPLDRVGEHSVTFALIEIADREGTAAGLASTLPGTRRAALMALDQMRGGSLEAADVVPLLEAADPRLRETAWRIALRHTEWGGSVAPHFERRLRSPGRRAEDHAELERQLAAFSRHSAVQALIATTAAAGPEAVRATALRAMAAARLSPLPSAWAETLASVARGAPPALARHAVMAAGASPDSLPGSSLEAALIDVARDGSRPIDLRVDALGAATLKGEALDGEQFELVRDALGASQPVALRLSASAIVERAALSAAQLEALAALVRHAGPLELNRLLKAFDRGGGEALGLALVAALEAAPGRSNLRPDELRPRLEHYPAAVRARGEALLASLTVDAAEQATRLDGMVGGMVGGGDIRRGQLLFNSAKTACASCHAMGYRGGTLGPDLTAIGQIRTERDLLEAIVFPNASFARGYEPVVLTTARGASYAGVLKEESAEQVVVAAASGETTAVPRSEIADLQPGAVSIMPSGYGDQLTRQELADLVAFLKNARWGAN